MNESNKELLENEIQQELEALKEMEIGTDEYKVAVDGLTKLLDRAIDLKKIEVDSESKDKDREIERELKLEQIISDRDQREFDEKLNSIDMEFKEKQRHDERVNNIIGHSIAAAGIVIPILVTIWGTYKTFEFEKEGTITTMPGRSFIGNLFRKK